MYRSVGALQDPSGQAWNTTAYQGCVASAFKICGDKYPPGAAQDTCMEQGQALCIGGPEGPGGYPVMCDTALKLDARLAGPYAEWIADYTTGTTSDKLRVATECASAVAAIEDRKQRLVIASVVGVAVIGGAIWLARRNG